MGEKEITLEQLVKMLDGKKLILALNDSTRITCIYNGFKEIENENKIDTLINIEINSNSKTIKTSEINKYIYVNEGGSVITAFTIGAVIDIIIYIVIENSSLGIGPVFYGPM